MIPFWLQCLCCKNLLYSTSELRRGAHWSQFFNRRQTDRQILAAFLTILSYLISGLVFSPISHRTEEILWPFHPIDLNIDLSCLSWLEMHWSNLVLSLKDKLTSGVWGLGGVKFFLFFFFFFFGGGGRERYMVFRGKEGESIVAIKGDHKNTGTVTPLVFFQTAYG